MDAVEFHSLLGELEKKDHATAAHTWRVVLYARALAELAGVENDMLPRIARGAALHDVGKIDIPTAILRKAGPLTPSEYDVIRKHPILGYERLQRAGETDPVVLNLVRHHHEWWDGAGYPDRLRGEEIPLGARFFSVIDAFDAMTSIRPYRADVGPGAAERALEELRRGVGTRYCGESVALFGDLYRSGRVDWVLTYYNDSAALALNAADTPWD